MCSEHALSLIQSLVAKRQRSCVAQSVEQSPGLREVLGSNPGTADQCFSAIILYIHVFSFFVVNVDILLYNLLFSGFPAHNLKILWNCSIYIYIYIIGL